MISIARIKRLISIFSYFGFVSFLVACGGGGGGSTPADTTSKLEEDTSRAVTVSVTPDAGETITLSNAEGVDIVFDIPANALLQETDITVTPLTSLGVANAGENLLAGVKFEPEGVVFSAPATLTLTLPGSPGTPIQAVGFLGNGDIVYPRPFTQDGLELTLSVLHFSGVAVIEDGAVTTNADQISGAEAVESQITEYLQTFNADDKARAVQVLQTWYNDDIRPNLLNAAEDRNGFLASAISDFVKWKELAAFYSLNPDLGTEIAEGDGFAVDAFEAALHADNDVCRQTLSVDAATEVIRWQNLAEWSGYSIYEQFQLATVIENLCLKVIFTGIDVPDQISPGETVPIEINAAIEFDNGARITDQPLNVHISSDENVIPEDGQTDSNGILTAEGSLVDGSNELGLGIRLSLPQILNVAAHQYADVPGTPWMDLGVKLPGELDGNLAKNIEVNTGDEVWLVGFAKRGLGAAIGKSVNLNISSGNGALNDNSLLSDGDGRFNTEFLAGDQDATVTASFVDQGELQSDSVNIIVQQCVLEPDQHCCPSQVALGMVDCCNLAGACACVASAAACESFQNQ